MVNLIRRFQQPLLVVLTVLVIIAFVVLYGGPGSRIDKLGSDSFARIYDRDVNPTEYQSIGRQFEVARMLGMFDLILPLSQNARTMQDAVENYVWNTMVLRHEARQLGISPTENQIAEAIQQLPAFQNNGKYDHSRYTTAMQSGLSPRGMTPEKFEALIADSIRMQSIRDVLSASSSPAPDEIEQAYKTQFQKVQASVIRLSRDEIAKTVKVSDEDLKKSFEARKDGLKTPEKRSVEFVLFPLPAADKESKKPDPETIQKLADKATDFAGACLEPNAKFEEVAKRFELEVKSTGMFAMAERVEALSNQTRVAAAAFQLSKEKPFSEALGSPKGYFILHLKNLEEARPLSFEEAKAKLSEDLKAEKIRETLSLKSAAAKAAIEKNLQAGKSISEAAQSEGLKAETPEPFANSDTKLTFPDSTLIQRTVSGLKEGEVSSAVEAADGVLLVHLAKRLPIDPADIEKKRAELLPMLESQRTDGLLSEWIERKRAAANLQLMQNR